MHTTRHRVLAVFALMLCLALPTPNPVAEAAPAQTPAPGVGYTHAWTTDANRGNAKVPLDWWYLISDVTGLAQAKVDLGDGAISYGLHTMPGVYAGGANRQTGSRPMIVFSHGTGGIGYQNYTLFRDLAAAGYIVVAPTHRGHSIVDTALNIPFDDFTQTLNNRHRDISFAINTTAALWGSKWNGQVVTMGHSQGGMNAITQATGINAYLLPDARVQAIVSIAPAAFLLPIAGLPLTHLRSLHKPMLILDALDDEILRSVGTNEPLAGPIEILNEVVDHNNGDAAPYVEYVGVPDTDHNATADVMALDATVQASNIPQAAKAVLTQDVDWLCPPDRTDTQACEDEFHAVQFDAIYRFLEEVL